MGVVTAALGLSLIGGEHMRILVIRKYHKTLCSGTLDLSVNPEVVINVDNIKPVMKWSVVFN